MSDKRKPLVTVKVPAYNHDPWVEETIMSIVNQTYGYENIQLIVTDDCSEDNTAIILDKLAAKYNFDLIIHKENKGICATINEMISISRGKYITGIASDDIMMLDRIEKQIEILTKNPDIDILAGKSILIDMNGNEIPTGIRKYDDSLSKYDFEDLFLRKKPGFPAGSAIIKRELYERIGTYDTNYKIEDYYFWLKAAHNNANIIVCNRPFLYYRVLNSSISSNTNLLEEEGKKILRIYEDHPKYSKALQVRKIQNLSKTASISKWKVILGLMKNPILILHRKTLFVIARLFLPKFIFKHKFQEIYFRNSTI